jgi:hypothetical protein
MRAVVETTVQWWRMVAAAVLLRRPMGRIRGWDPCRETTWIPPRRRKLSTLVVGCLGTSAACNLVDDEPRVDPDATSGGAGEDRQSCLETAAEIQAECEYPLQFWVSSEGGGSTMLLVDDPSASVGIGPGAWLVQVATAADYVGMYQYSGDSCEIGCGWCALGQHVCHGGLADDGLPLCWACLPFDAPDAAAACLAALSTCADGEGGSDDGTTSGTGGEDGVDETGSEVIEPGASNPYDCTMWRPGEGVSRDHSGALVLDATLIEDLRVFHGEPLVSCDATRFRWRSDGLLEVSRRADQGLLAQMGLVPGDVVLAIDGRSMNGYDAVMRTVDELLASGSRRTAFTLAIQRGNRRFVERVLVHDGNELCGEAACDG